MLKSEAHQEAVLLFMDLKGTEPIKKEDEGQWLLRINLCQFNSIHARTLAYQLLQNRIEA